MAFSRCFLATLMGLLLVDGLQAQLVLTRPYDLDAVSGALIYGARFISPIYAAPYGSLTINRTIIVQAPPTLIARSSARDPDDMDVSGMDLDLRSCQPPAVPGRSCTINLNGKSFPDSQRK